MSKMARNCNRTVIRAKTTVATACRSRTCLVSLPPVTPSTKHRKAAEVLAFAAEDCLLSTVGFSRAAHDRRMRCDPEFQERAADAVIAAVPIPAAANAAA